VDYLLKRTQNTIFFLEKLKRLTELMKFGKYSNFSDFGDEIEDNIGNTHQNTTVGSSTIIMIMMNPEIDSFVRVGKYDNLFKFVLKK
jgi:hypothetical protein